MQKQTKSVGRSDTVVTEQPNNTQNSKNDDFTRIVFRPKPIESVKDEHTITGFTNEDYSNVFKDNSTQSTRKSENFMDFTQNNQTVTPNKNDKYGQYLSENTIQQSKLNRAITGILQHTVSDMSSVDYVSGGQSIIDDFTMQQMKPLDDIQMMEMDDDESYKNIVNNNIHLEELNKKVKDKIVKEDDAKPLKLTTEQVLSNHFDFADIITVDRSEHNINTFRELAGYDYDIDENTIENSPLRLILKGNDGNVILDFIKNYIEQVTGKDITNIEKENSEDFIVFLVELLEKKDISDDKFLQYIKVNELYDLLTILNYIVNKESPNGLRKVKSEQLGVIAALIINTTINYFKAREFVRKRNDKITEFNQLLSVLQDVARHYVTASPQFVQVVQSLNIFFEQMENLAQNDVDFQSLIHGVSNQLNNFIRNGTVSRDNFNTITENFNLLYEHYQNLYAKSIGEHTNVAAQFNKMQKDIDILKNLFSILTSNEDPTKIAEVIATIRDTVEQVYFNKGFSEEQTQILLNLINMIKRDNYIVSQQIKDDINKDVQTIIMNTKQEIRQKIKMKFAKINNVLNSFKTFLANLPNESTTLPDILKGIENSIKKIESTVQENKKQIDDIDIRMKAIESNKITKDDYDKKIVDVQTTQNEQKTAVIDILVEQDTRFEMLYMALEEEYPEVTRRFKEISHDFKSSRQVPRSTSTYNGRLTTLYEPFMSDRDRILNDLTRIVDNGITIREYIRLSLARIDLIEKDDTTKFDDSIIKIKDNKKKIVALLYICEVYETLLQYNDIGLSNERDNFENMFNQIRETAMKLEKENLDDKEWIKVANTLDKLVAYLQGMLRTIDSDTDTNTILKVKKTVHPKYMSRLEKAMVSVNSFLIRLRLINKKDGQMALKINGITYKVDIDDILKVFHDIIEKYYDGLEDDFNSLLRDLKKAPDEKKVEILEKFGEEILKNLIFYAKRAKKDMEENREILNRGQKQRREKWEKRFGLKMPGLK